MEPADVFQTALARPLTSRSFARGPHLYTDREYYLVVTYRTRRAALEEAVPEPLTFEEPLVRCEFMRMESSTDFGRYSGAAPYIAEKLNGKPGPYTHNIYLDANAPMSGGRELWGLPQKLAKLRLAAEHDTLVGALEYGPVQVAKRARKGDRRSEETAEPTMRDITAVKDVKERRSIYEEDCTAAYDRCRSVRDKRRRSRDDHSGSEGFRRF